MIDSIYQSSNNSNRFANGASEGIYSIKIIIFLKWLKIEKYEVIKNEGYNNKRKYCKRK